MKYRREAFLPPWCYSLRGNDHSLTCFSSIYLILVLIRLIFWILTLSMMLSLLLQAEHAILHCKFSAVQVWRIRRALSTASCCKMVWYDYAKDNKSCLDRLPWLDAFINVRSQLINCECKISAFVGSLLWGNCELGFFGLSFSLAFCSLHSFQSTYCGLWHDENI